MDHSYNAETINYYFGKIFVIYFKPLSANNSVFMLHFFKIEQIQQMDYIGVTQLAQMATDRVR